MGQDLVRVSRVLEYVGTREWVEGTLARSIKGTMPCGRGKITETRGELVPVAAEPAPATAQTADESEGDWVICGALHFNRDRDGFDVVTRQPE